MDKYDYNIAELAAYPEEISSAWGHPDQNPVFAFAHVPGVDGCLTMIRNKDACISESKAAPEALALVNQIAADPRVPTTDELIDDYGSGGWTQKEKVAALPVLAEYQRQFDKIRENTIECPKCAGYIPNDVNVCPECSSEIKGH